MSIFSKVLILRAINMILLMTFGNTKNIRSCFNTKKMNFNNIYSWANYAKVSLKGSLMGIPLLVEKYSNFRQRTKKLEVIQGIVTLKSQNVCV